MRVYKILFLISIGFTACFDAGASPFTAHLIACEQMKHMRAENLLPLSPLDQERLRAKLYEIAYEQIVGHDASFEISDLLPCKY